MQEANTDIELRFPQEVCGAFDSNLRLIEKCLGIQATFRDDSLHIRGNEEAVNRAKGILEMLDKQAGEGENINRQGVEYLLSIENKADLMAVDALSGDNVYHTQNGRIIKPKTIGQKAYVEAMREKMIVFGVGPAGTGKTYLAMAMAVRAFKNGDVNRIILTRPAIEAGEKLGFLPGDLQSKIDPYLRPLYDALYQIMGAENVVKNMEKGIIEVAPLAYMRGRTLDNAFIILDEAQNTTKAQMKMFLTRIGFGSRVVITGDASQKDLDSNVMSGLEVAEKILKNIEDISFCHLSKRDVVRHPLVQKIVSAYEDYEKRFSDSKEGYINRKGKSKKEK